jgi:RHS repeat-associated protein
MAGQLSGHAGVELLISSNSTTCANGNYTVSVADLTLSAFGPSCGVTTNVPEGRVDLEVGRTYELSVAGPVCSTHLRFEVPSCYALFIDGVQTTNYDKGGLGDTNSGTGTAQLELRSAHDWVMEFDVEKIDDRYVLAADGVSVAHPSIQRPYYFAAQLTPPLFWSIESADPLDCQIDPTNGTVRAGEREGVITVKVVDSSVPPCQVLENLELRRCDSCASADCPIGSVDVEVGSASVAISLGRAARGISAGRLTVHGTNVAADLSALTLLRYNFRRNDVEVIRNGQAVIVQVKAPQGLVHVVPASAPAAGYFLQFYRLSQVVAKTNGVYQLTGTPFATVTLWNPQPGSGGLLNVIDGNGGSHAFVGTGNEWSLSSASGLRVEKKQTAWSETNTVRTVVHSIVDSAGRTNAISSRTYRRFAWGEVLAAETSGAGAGARTNTYTYSADGSRRDSLLADGSWAIEFFDANRRVTNRFAAFGDQAPTTNKALCRFTEFLYATNPSDLVETNRPRYVTEYILGTEVSQRQISRVNFEKEEVVCWANNGACELVSRVYPHTSGAFSGLIKSIQFADGTYETYTPSTNRLTNEVSRWAELGSTGTNLFGEKTVTVTGSVGEMLSRAVIDAATGKTNALEIYSDHDEERRPRRVSYLDGTFTYTVYGCCGPQTMTNREGTVTTYAYDALKRLQTESVNGLVYGTVYNAAGNVLGRSRRGTDSSVITNATSAYDQSGRLTNSWDALLNPTKYDEVVAPLTRTVTLPDGGQRIEEYFRDGTLRRVSGTAEFPARYEYGVTNGTVYGLSGNFAFRKEIKLGASGNDTPEWTLILFDPLRRAVKTTQAAAGGQPNPTRQRVFNSLGQLEREIDPDGITTLYLYSPFQNGAEPWHTILETVPDGNPTWNSDTERVSLTLTSNTNAHGIDVRRRETSIYDQDGSGNLLPVSTVDTSLDGLRTWSFAFGLTNRSETIYTNGNRYVLATAPDGTTTVSCYSTGRLISVQVTNAALGTLRSVTYAYDVHGRQSQTTDARTGTATFYYDNADRLEWSGTPPPAAGQNPLWTGYTYDPVGRLWYTSFPDGAAEGREYHTNGLLRLRYGDRVYPEERQYDAQGRLTGLVTWTNFSAGQGVVTNRWTYDAYRGQLNAKVFPDGTSNTWAYTNSGRLVLRTWARGVQTRYGYTVAGDLGVIDYSDTTPDVTLSRDRNGRIKQVLEGTNVTTLTYNDASQVSGEVRNGLLQTNTYDTLLRRTQRRLNYGRFYMGYLQEYNLNNFGYDAASRLAGVTNYDVLGVQPELSAAYSYLALSPLVQDVTFRRGATPRLVSQRAYDNLDRLTGLTHSTNGVTAFRFGYAYNFASQRTAVTNADNSRWDYAYDVLGQVTSGKRVWSDGSLAAGQQFEYGFDDIGNRQYAASGGDASGANLRQQNYTANNLNQYTQRTVPGYAAVLGRAEPAATVTVNQQPVTRLGPARDFFRYEQAVNNSTGAVWLGLTNVGVRNQTGQPDIVTTNTASAFAPKTPETLTFDLDGNLIGDGRWTNKWDGENRLIEMESTGAVPPAQRLKLVNTYDWQNRRVSQTVSNWTGSAYQFSNTVKWVWDGTRPQALLDTNNLLLQWFVWGSDLSGTLDGAGGVGGLLALAHNNFGYGGNAGWFAAADAQGSVAGVVDAAGGQIAARFEYGPFGEPLRAAGPAALYVRLRWSSKWEDEETGLVYYGYRYYEPITGRWWSRDPIAERGGANLYGFVYNNPLGYYDYLGREGYWSDVGTTFEGMGQGALTVGKEVGAFAGDLLLGFVVVVTPDCCCNSLLTKLDDIGYKGSSLTAGAGGEYGGLKTGGKVFIAPVVAAIGVPVNGYQSVQAALNGDLNAAGNKMGQALTTGGLLAAPLAKGPGGTGGYTGVGTVGEAVYNLSPTLFGELPAATRLNIIRQANRTCESSLIKDMGADAVSQFQVYPRLQNGQLATWWYTADGVCTRGGLQIREFKASPTAPLTGNQPAALPLLEQYGGAVRSLKGDGLGLPQGTVLPPIRVQVIRQNQFQASETVLPALGGNSK